MWQENQLELVKKCSFCGSSNVKFMLTRPDSLSVHECLDCGFTYLSRRPNATALKAYYDSSYFQDSDTYQDYFNCAQAESDLNYSPRLHRISSFYDNWQDKRVLDVGCAAGSTLAILKRKGAQVSGIEISADAVRIARNEYGLSVFAGPLEEASLPEKSFDIILAFDVLEHLPDAGVALVKLVNALDKQGLLILTVPNFDRFSEEGLNWPGIQSYFEHLNYFPSGVLIRKLKELGMKIIEQHTYASGLADNNEIQSQKMRQKRRQWKERFPFLSFPLRLARKLNFILRGRPHLDIRYDGSGMDLFIICRKEFQI